MPYEIPTRWPLVETLQNREGDFFKDARLVNCYAEFNPQDKSYSVERRPGIGDVLHTVPNGNAQGVFTFDNSVIQLTGGKAYRSGIFLGPIGTGPGSNGLYEFSATSTDTDVLMFAYPNAGYYLSGFILNQITDPNYPPVTAPGIAYLNGTFYVMDPAGRIFGSRNLDDPSAWDPLNVIVAAQKAGAGIFLATQLSYICAMKQNSTEIFADTGQTVGGTGSTLQPFPSAIIPYGCFAAGSVQDLDGTLIWMTTNLSGSPQVGRLDNLQFQIVSTPNVDRLLKQASFSTTNSFTLKLGGHRFYVLQISPVTSIAFTLVYDLDQNLWYRWTDPVGLQWPYYNSCALGTASPPVTLVQGVNGQTYITSEDYVLPTDRGVIVPVDIYTPNYDANIDREKYMPALYFNADIVQGSLIQVRWSDDDYNRWNNPQTVNLGIKKPMLTDLGSFYRRAFHIRHAMPTPFRIKSVGMTMGLGTL